MSTDFGNTDFSGGADSGYGGYTLGNKATVFYTCPGSGDQTVDYFKAYCRFTSGSINIKLAIYSSDLSTKIGESETAAVADNTAQWRTLAPSASITLTGGTTYAFAWSIQVGGDNLYWYYKTTTNGYCGYQSGDYTGSAFPASLTLGTNMTKEPTFIVGVTAAAGGSTVPAKMMHLARLRRK